MREVKEIGCSSIYYLVNRECSCKKNPNLKKIKRLSNSSTLDFVIIPRGMQVNIRILEVKLRNDISDDH